MIHPRWPEDSNRCNTAKMVIKNEQTLFYFDCGPVPLGHNRKVQEVWGIVILCSLGVIWHVI
jgi:hypothetical protein